MSRGADVPAFTWKSRVFLFKYIFFQLHINLRGYGLTVYKTETLTECLSLGLRQNLLIYDFQCWHFWYPRKRTRPNKLLIFKFIIFNKLSLTKLKPGDLDFANICLVITYTTIYASVVHVYVEPRPSFHVCVAGHAHVWDSLGRQAWIDPEAKKGA